MKDRELKPCPFCGMSPIITHYSRAHYYIACAFSECKVMPRTFSYKTEKEAIIAWNMRTREAAGNVDS